MKSVYAAIAAIGIGVPALAFADTPTMDPDVPVRCGRDHDGNVWRIQCNPATKVCLYAAGDELDVDGNRIQGKALDRARECASDEAFDRAKLEADGWKIVPGIADAPWGWTRDERGRVFQTNFDLRRRMYIGAAYTPQKVLENPFESTRTSIDFGLLVMDIYHPGKTPTRHRLRLFEGQVHVQPFASEVTIVHYDVSHRFFDPLVRITTFVGEPARHDLHLDLGLWTEGGSLELRRTDYGDSQLYKHASAQVTLDLWQSPDMDSFVRLRWGGGVEGQHDAVNGYRSALTETAAFDIDSVLDDKGFHNVRFELAHEIPRYFTPYDTMRGKLVQRMRARLQYEAIVLAINDQPLTLKLAAGGEKRNDIPGVPDQWAFVLDAGLRFSLWAPPRPH